MGKRTMRNECYSCSHKSNVPGNCHIRCDEPDPDMTGDRVGEKNGWFIYPLLFDPVWKTKDCTNFEKAEGEDND